MAWHPLRNLGLKTAALALGTLLWFTVSGHEIERRLWVPVSYSNIPNPLEMTGDQIDEVSVHVRGGDNVVNQISQGDLRVIVNLSDAHSGTNLLPLRTDEVIAPLGVEVLQLDPGTVTVTLERSGEVSVPVHPNIEGQPPAGFALGAVTVQPATVSVRGPESRLKSPVSVVTERIMLDGHAGTFTQDVSVGVADAQLRLGDPRTVRVTVVIRRESSAK